MSLFLCFAVALAFASGCASTPYRIAFSPDATPQLKSDNVSGVIALEKEQIGSSHEAATPKFGLGMFPGAPPLSGGLPGGRGLSLSVSGYIDVSAIKAAAKARKNMEAAVESGRNSLSDYSFEQVLADAFTKRFAGAGGMQAALSTIVISKNTALSEIPKLVNNASGDAVVVVFVRYFMSPDLYNVVLEAEVVVSAKSDALRKIATMEFYDGNDVPVLYRNTIQTAWRIPGVDKTAKLAPEEVVAKWTDENAAKLRAALDAAASELAELVRWDLEQPARENYGDSGATVAMEFYSLSPTRKIGEGTVYRHENNRLWLRDKDGRLFAQ